MADMPLKMHEKMHARPRSVTERSRTGRSARPARNFIKQSQRPRRKLVLGAVVTIVP